MMTTSQKIPWFQSIKFKTVWITILFNTLILGGFIGFHAATTRARIERDLQELAEVTVARLATHLTIPLWDLDKTQIEDTIGSEMLEKRMYAIVVQDSDGKSMFAGKMRDSAWKLQPLLPQQHLPTTGDLITRQKHITNGKEKIGTVEVSITRKFQQEEFVRSMVTMVTNVVVLNIGLFIAMVLVLQRTVIRPVAKLAEAADIMSKGDLTVSIDVNTGDEIGHVADAMERMKISLQMAMKRLQQTSVR